jgi:hypothetical protein
LGSTSGNVGIGAAPFWKLQVSSPTVTSNSAVGLFINDPNLFNPNSSSWVAWGRFADPAFNGLTSGIRVLHLGNNGFEQGMAFHTASAGVGALSSPSSSEVFRITNTRNMIVGGTTDAGYKLDVNGTARVSGTTTLSTLAGTGSRMVVADATGILSTQAIPVVTVKSYGAFQDNTTQTAVSANTAYPVQLNTTDLTNGVSVVNDGSGNPTRVTLANTGIYNIQFSLQLEKTGGSGNFIVDIWVRKNGVDIPATTGKVVLTGSANASPIVAAWNYVLDLAAGDYIQLMWSTSNNNAIILAAAAAAPHPSVPSAILTVNQVN